MSLSAHHVWDDQLMRLILCGSQESYVTMNLTLKTNPSGQAGWSSSGEGRQGQVGTSPWVLSSQTVMGRVDVTLLGNISIFQDKIMEHAHRTHPSPRL